MVVSIRVSVDVCRLMVVSWWVFVVGEMSLDGCLGLSRWLSVGGCLRWVVGLMVVYSWVSDWTDVA